MTLRMPFDDCSTDCRWRTGWRVQTATCSSSIYGMLFLHGLNAAAAHARLRLAMLQVCQSATEP